MFSLTKGVLILQFI